MVEAVSVVFLGGWVVECFTEVEIFSGGVQIVCGWVEIGVIKFFRNCDFRMLGFFPGNYMYMRIVQGN